MTAVRRLRVIETESRDPVTTQTPAVRVAIATQDRKTLDAHFGSARCFIVYDVTAEGWTQVEIITFDTVSDELGKHDAGGDDRISPKVEALAGCHLLYCAAIGGPSAAKVVAAKIHPIKMQTQPIEAALERTRTMLSGSPPPWLRKALAGTGLMPEKRSFVDDE